MTSDVKNLTKQWIQYLKNNRIVALRSDSQTGKLNYNRPVTSDDLINFLEVKTEFSPEDVSAAIHMVMARKGVDNQAPKLSSPGPEEPGRDLSTQAHHGTRTGDHPSKQIGKNDDVTDRSQPRGKSKTAGSADDISDIDYREVSPKDNSEKGKSFRKFFSRLRKVKENIADIADFELNEQDVELLFRILASGEASSTDKESSENQGKSEKKTPSPAEVQNKKEEDMRKIKRLIRDVMTDTQRRSFWRILNDQETLEESQINNADVKAILATASEQRNKPAGLGRIFKGLRKDKIELADLQQAWKSEGYPDDTRDIKALLLGHGFSEEEIKKAFSQVFGSRRKGDEEEPDLPGQSATLLKIARYAEKNNLTQDIINFMSREFGFKESFHNNKLMIEDIRHIFTAIVRENRYGRADLIKMQDKIRLGRTKK